MTQLKALKSLTSYTGLPHSMYYEFLSISLYTYGCYNYKGASQEDLPDMRSLFSFVELSYLLRSLHPCADRLISIIQEL